MREPPPQKPFEVFAWMTLVGTIAVSLINVLALPWQLCFSIPGSLGPSYVGMNAVVLLAIVYPLLPGLVPFESAAQFRLYTMAYYATIGLCLFHRLASLGNRQHSHFVGKEAFRLPVQALIAAGLHFGLLGVSPQLAWLFPASFIAKCVHFKLIALRYRVLLRRFRDQKLEASHINDIIRDL